jgi:Tfp pilus assembly protein PilO
MSFRDKQQIAICVVAAMLIVDFVLFGCLPLRTRLKAINTARAAQKLIVSKAVAEQKQLPILKEQLAKLKQTVGDHHVTVPAQTDFGVFLQQIAGLMSGQNLTEQVVTPGAEIHTEDLNCIPVNLQCKGRLVHIFEFFRQLQQLDRLIRIESVKLINDRELGGQVSMETQAFVYYRPDVEKG